MGRQFNRRVHLPAVLSAAFVITILVQPCAICDVGLQLSYAATLGLVYGASAATRLIVGDRKSFNRLKSWFAESLAAVLCAQAAVLPLQLEYFWEYSLLSIPSNLIVAPLVSPVSLLGFVASMLVGIQCLCGQTVLGQIPLLTTMANLLDGCSGLMLRIIEVVVGFASGQTWGTITLGRPEVIYLIFYIFGLVFFLVCLNGDSRRLILPAIVYSASLLCICSGHLLPPTIAVFSDSLLVIDGAHRARILRTGSKSPLDADKPGASGAKNGISEEYDSQGLELSSSERRYLKFQGVREMSMVPMEPSIVASRGQPKSWMVSGLPKDLRVTLIEAGALDIDAVAEAPPTASITPITLPRAQAATCRGKNAQVVQLHAGSQQIIFFDTRRFHRVSSHQLNFSQQLNANQQLTLDKAIGACEALVGSEPAIVRIARTKDQQYWRDWQIQGSGTGDAQGLLIDSGNAATLGSWRVVSCGDFCLTPQM